MAFSDEDGISIENWYIFKGYGAKKLIEEFPNKGWDCGDKKYQCNFKTKRKRSTTTAGTDNIDTLVFILCYIHTQTVYYKKGIYRLVQI